VVSGDKAKPADPARSGHVFDGWYKEASLTNKWDFTTDTVSKSITLYAKWVLSYGLTLTFEQISEGSPTFTIPVISRTGAGGRPTYTTVSVATPDQYDSDSITWVIPAYNIFKTDSSIYLDSMDFMVGKHYITLEVKKNGVPYSRTITFEVIK